MNEKELIEMFKIDFTKSVIFNETINKTIEEAIRCSFKAGQESQKPPYKYNVIQLKVLTKQFCFS